MIKIIKQILHKTYYHGAPKKKDAQDIGKRKLKFYTKEALKFFNITLVSFGFIIAIVLIKYKPMYEVKISGEEIGYIKNKKVH